MPDDPTNDREEKILQLPDVPDNIIKYIEDWKETLLVDFKREDYRNQDELLRDVAAFANTGESPQTGYIIIGINDPHKDEPKFNANVQLLFEQRRIVTHNDSINNKAASHFRHGIVGLSYDEYRVSEYGRVYGVGVYTILPQSRPVYFGKDGVLWVRRSDHSRSPSPFRVGANPDDFIRLYSEDFSRHQIGFAFSPMSRQDFAERLKETVRGINAQRFLANLLLDDDANIRKQAIPAIAELGGLVALPLLSGVFLYDPDFEVRYTAWKHIIDFKHLVRQALILAGSATREVCEREAPDDEWVDFLLEQIKKLDADTDIGGNIATPLLSGVFLNDPRIDVRCTAWQYIVVLLGISRESIHLVESAIRQVCEQDDPEELWVDFLLEQAQLFDAIDHDLVESLIHELRQKSGSAAVRDKARETMKKIREARRETPFTQEDITRKEGT